MAVPFGGRHCQLDWLEGLRLITKTEAKGKAPHCELAHECLIPSLRNLAGKTLSEAGQANILLERRANEWIANDKKRRFLLSWGEYRNILGNEKLLVWGKSFAFFCFSTPNTGSHTPNSAGETSR
ncbi:MAG: hypothetical protein H6557_32815 [Lewinellaceae bacterium]|nr:hypothetical protein [Lewinellaceae bacterium]